MGECAKLAKPISRKEKNRVDGYKKVIAVSRYPGPSARPNNDTKTETCLWRRVLEMFVRHKMDADLKKKKKNQTKRNKKTKKTSGD